MRRYVRAIMAMIVAAIAPATSPAIDGSALLPDLGMLEPRNFRIENQPDGNRLLRFDSVLVNAGPGAFEVSGSEPASDGTLTVTQRVQHDAGGWAARSTEARMIFAGDGHDHWHVRELQMFTIVAADAPTVSLGRDVKVGFCFSDNHGWVSHSPAAYTDGACELRSDGRVTMGLSIGWGDEYASTLAYQYINITELADGEYMVLLMADPADEFLEADERNNAGWATITLSSDTATVVSGVSEIAEP